MKIWEQWYKGIKKEKINMMEGETGYEKRYKRRQGKNGDERKE